MNRKEMNKTKIECEQIECEQLWFVVKINEARKRLTDIFLNCWLDLIMNFLLLTRHDILIMKLTAAKK